MAKMHVSIPRVALTLAALTQIVMLSGCAASLEHLVRCQSEDDLDGIACRVDMLPDDALAKMIYER